MSRMFVRVFFHVAPLSQEVSWNWLADESPPFSVRARPRSRPPPRLTTQGSVGS